MFDVSMEAAEPPDLRITTVLVGVISRQDARPTVSPEAIVEMRGLDAAL
jgi:hypothetical protein